MPEKDKPSRLPVLKSLGQNFLHDKNIVSKMIKMAGVTKDDTVLEIGPGRGDVTFVLAETAKEVVAVEIDRGLAKRLTEIVPRNVKIIHADAKRIDFTKSGLESGRYIVVASLPFNVGTVILRRLLENPVKPQRIVVILQVEVIDRILAIDGQESILSLSVKLYGQARKLFSIPRSAYTPAPRVDTGVLEIKINEKPALGEHLHALYFALIKAGFSSRRKYLTSNLAKKLGIPLNKVKNGISEIGYSEKTRAEELSFADWLALTDLFK